METELPFKVEYAKSGRAGCKGCKSPINQGTLRIAVLVQSAFHDGKTPNWFHESCFFNKQRPKTVGDIENFENLRNEDQARIKKKVDEISSLPVLSLKGKKRSIVQNSALNDFGVEYAKSARAECRGCEQKIMKNEIRIKKTVYDTEVGMKYGGQPLWHHVECFAQLRAELGWYASGEDLPGFKTLSVEDQSKVIKFLPTIKMEFNLNPKKPKVEHKDESKEIEYKKLNDKAVKQQKRIFIFRDYVKDNMTKNDIITLLEYNKQTPISGDSEKLLDQVSDLLTFGALPECPDCKNRQFLFHKSGYLCNGELTEWTKCTKLLKEPFRKECKIPRTFKDRFQLLKDVKKEPETRIIRFISPSAISLTNHIKKNEDEGPRVKREKPPLYNFKFSQIGLKSNEDELKKSISKLGGHLDNKITENTVAVFSTKKDVENLSGRMIKVKELGIHVIPIEYLSAVGKMGSNAINYISSMTICDWGTDPASKVTREDEKSSRSKSIYTKSIPKSMTLKVKDGLAVDPESGLENEAHVFVKDKENYSVVLALTDIQRNKNSYYKLQLLESDKKNKYWVFRAWGRIGTTIGGNKLETFSTHFEALEVFRTVYLDKTGNDFKNRDYFTKISGRFYPIDIDYSEENGMDLSKEHKIKSKLQPPVQDLIKLLFDVDAMKRTLLEFNLDMEKMPLGKLSQKQIQLAYSILTELYDLIKNSGSSANFVDATNRFYTLIPQNFGIQKPPLLDTIDQIEKLRQMLDSLLEIEYAYNLIKSEDINDNSNPLDRHYEQLKTKLEPLDKKSEEFALLQKYVRNTHAETHNMYKLEILDIFKVVRQGESRRFKPFKKLHNRKLLWHGSRLTNFAGILSHGLKIAPPEAPVTGYMFGKGIYFADMVSKSANYCCTNEQNSTGLMLLSEVALGDMMECTVAKYITKLPKDKHSCFGRGRTMPDLKESYFREDGVEIPLGTPIVDEKLKSSLLYNEYIVYDIAQVNIQYLLRLNFDYRL